MNAILDFDRLKILSEAKSIPIFSEAVQQIIRALVSGESLPISLKGRKDDIKLFSDTLKKEINHIKTVMKFGENHPRSTLSGGQLDVCIKNFEKETGILWPIK